MANQIDKSKFKNASGVRLLEALFFERVLKDKSSCVYTLKDVDHEGFPSLYRLYMEEEDLTEYNFAKKHLDGWDHWVRLCECPWFKPIVERWRAELDVKIRSEAMAIIINEATQGGSYAFQAAKYIVEKGWEPKQTKGRPSKQAIKDAAWEIANEKSSTAEDAKRLGLH